MRPKLKGQGDSPTLTIRIPADLKKAVEAAALRDDRTVTSYIVHALRAAVGAKK